MKHYFNLCSAALCLAFLFAGCETDERFDVVETNSKTPTVQEFLSTNKLQEDDLPDYFVTQLEKFETTVINTYTVKFDGRTVTGTGESTSTTFTYLVSGGGATPQLDSFTLELPSCAGSIIRQSPSRAFNLFSDAIKWNNSVSKDGSQEYSITFRGNIPLGVINATATRGSTTETKEILGPCKGVYTLEGNIFIDSNDDGIKQAYESGISSFTINLFDEYFDENKDPIGSVKTSANGFYSFKVLKGNYGIAVNGDLLNDRNYTAVGNSFLNLENVRANGTGYNFGYLINTSKIIRELDERIIRVNTEPTRYWVQQIRNAGKKGSLYSKEEIRSLLISVEGVLLPEPFNFGLDKEAGALSILTDSRNEFLQQLLTAELNIARGWGAFDPETNTLNTRFNTALLIYSEAVACSELGSCPAETISTSSRAAEVKAVRSSNTQMLLSFNGSGGV